MKNYTLLIIGTFFVLTIALIGCAAKEVKSDLNVNKITYSFSYGDRIGGEIYVISSDFSMQRYIIKANEDTDFDIETGELPSEGEYWLEEYTIPQENWKLLKTAVEENKFMELPENVSNSAEVFDAGFCYIEVETNDATHRVGGFDAGGGKDKANKKFYGLKEEIINAIASASEKEE